MRNESWREDAACLGTPTELFFPSPGEHELIDTALRICASCPVAAECLAYAKDMGAFHGIWGGKSAYRRTRARNREARERRPPVNARTRQHVLDLIADGWIDSDIAKEVDISPRTVYRIREAAAPAQERATA